MLSIPDIALSILETNTNAWTFQWNSCRKRRRLRPPITIRQAWCRLICNRVRRPVHLHRMLELQLQRVAQSRRVAVHRRPPAPRSSATWTSVYAVSCKRHSKGYTWTGKKEYADRDRPWRNRLHPRKIIGRHICFNSFGLSSAHDEGFGGGSR